MLQVRELRLLEVLRLAQGHMVKKDYLNHPLPAKLTHPHPMAASLCVGEKRLARAGAWGTGQNRWHKDQCWWEGTEQPGMSRASWTIQVSCALTVATLLTADQPVPRDHSL